MRVTNKIKIAEARVRIAEAKLKALKESEEKGSITLDGLSETDVHNILYALGVEIDAAGENFKDDDNEDAVEGGLEFLELFRKIEKASGVDGSEWIQYTEEDFESEEGKKEESLNEGEDELKTLTPELAEEIIKQIKDHVYDHETENVVDLVDEDEEDDTIDETLRDDIEDCVNNILADNEIGVPDEDDEDDDENSPSELYEDLCEAVFQIVVEAHPCIKDWLDL